MLEGEAKCPQDKVHHCGVLRSHKAYCEVCCEVLIKIRWAEAHCATGLIAYHGVDACLQTQTFIVGFCVLLFSFSECFSYRGWFVSVKAVDFLLLLVLLRHLHIGTANNWVYCFILAD